MWIRFRCDVVTALSVSYNWTGYCINHGSNQTVFRHTNYNDTEVFTLLVRSTPTVCLDIVVCSVVDSVGNTGEGIWKITNVTGKNHAQCKFTVKLHIAKWTWFNCCMQWIRIHPVILLHIIDWWFWDGWPVEVCTNSYDNLQVLVFGARRNQFQTTVHLLLTQLDGLVKYTATLRHNSHT